MTGHRGQYRTLAMVIAPIVLLANTVRADDFLDRIDPEPLKTLGVQYRGRVTVLDTVARQQLKQMTGTERFQGRQPVVAYLDIYFRSDEYLTRPVLHVREKAMQVMLAARMTGPARDELLADGRIRPEGLIRPEARRYLVRMGRAEPTPTTSPSVPSLEPVLNEIMQQLANRLLIDRLSARFQAFMAVAVFGLPSGNRWETTDAHLAEPTPLAALRDAWRAGDADRVNTLARQLVPDASVAPDDYPSGQRARLELLYNRIGNGTMLWIGYALAVVLTVVALASAWPMARRAALAAFALTTLAMVASFVLRWIVSGRAWYLPPMMNQSEAVTASALLGAIVALGLELKWKRNYVLLAAGLYGTIALLCVHFVPIFFPGRMESSLSALPGLLSSKVMAVHVSVIIVGHAMVGMTFFISMVYLCAWAFRGRSQSVSADLCGPEPTDALAAIDRGNLIVAQIACWTVLVGTVLGAYWGDIAWGRWWGWDRKETWALLTVLIYIVILHLRFVLPARHRGPVTAVGCVLGFAVMMFNWVVVNFFLSGMHSYA